MHTVCDTTMQWLSVCVCVRHAVQEMSTTVVSVTLNFVGKFKGKRLVGSRRKLEDNIKRDPKEM